MTHEEKLVHQAERIDECYNILDVLWEKMLDRREFACLGQNTSCWLSKGTDDPQSYNKVRHNYKEYGVHIVSLMRKLGRKLDVGMTVYHQCRILGCWNPGHLREVTLSENTRRARKKVFFKEEAYKIKF